jgi:undecaprenyl-diphosphatase
MSTAAVLVARLHRDAVFLVVSVAGAGVLNVLLKGFFERPRPAVFPHLVETATSSFPSGHTMSSAALALAVVVVLRRSPLVWIAGALAVTYALTVAASRVYLGVHFPSDVVAGWTVAVGWVTLCWLVVLDRPWRRRDGHAGQDGDGTTAAPASLAGAGPGGDA